MVILLNVLIYLCVYGFGVTVGMKVGEILVFSKLKIILTQMNESDRLQILNNLQRTESESK